MDSRNLYYIVLMENFIVCKIEHCGFYFVGIFAKSHFQIRGTFFIFSRIINFGTEFIVKLNLPNFRIIIILDMFYVTIDLEFICGQRGYKLPLIFCRSNLHVLENFENIFEVTRSFDYLWFCHFKCDWIGSPNLKCWIRIE